VGGGLGRTPYLALEAGSFVSKRDILAFLEAVLRVYNEAGRRDNLWKARVKILVHQVGIEEMRRRIENEFAEIKSTGMLELSDSEQERIAAFFAPPKFDRLSPHSAEFETAKANSPEFAGWTKTNLHAHKG